jgi:hypothetical protein
MSSEGQVPIQHGVDVVPPSTPTETMQTSQEPNRGQEHTATTAGFGVIQVDGPESDTPHEATSGMTSGGASVGGGEQFKEEESRK